MTADAPLSVTRPNVSEAGHLLVRACTLLDRANVGHCIMAGYENFPDWRGSDVDVVIDRRVPPATLLRLFIENRDFLGAEVLRNDHRYFLVARSIGDGSVAVLHLDFDVDCQFDGLVYVSGEEILSNRRRWREFRVPAPHIEFACQLARMVVKNRCDNTRLRRLRELHHMDPRGCAAQARRLCGELYADLALAWARHPDRPATREDIAALRGSIMQKAGRRGLFRRWIGRANRLAGRARRLMSPDGVHVVFLGPDGAGKSTIADRLARALSDVFPRSVCLGFAPSLSRLVHSSRRTDQPHALPPRSRPVSVARAFYWLAFSLWSFIPLRIAKARATLITNDRHFVDLMVDARRYRYGGPMWLVRAIRCLTPRPDAFILLDASAETLQTRKQEVPFAETKRQREAYLGLVRSLPNGHVVDAEQPIDRVVSNACDIVLDVVTRRMAGPRCR